MKINNNEIKKSNRKALLKFILTMIICGIVDGLLGFFSAMYGLDALSEIIKEIGEFFGNYVAPWLILSETIIIPVVLILLYNKVKKMIDTRDGEDEDIYDIIDKKLSVINVDKCLASIILFFLILAEYSRGFTNNLILE